jgi:hypothetical protein
MPDNPPALTHGGKRGHSGFSSSGRAWSLSACGWHLPATRVNQDVQGRLRRTSCGSRPATRLTAFSVRRPYRRGQVGEGHRRVGAGSLFLTTDTSSPMTGRSIGYRPTRCCTRCHSPSPHDFPGYPAGKFATGNFDTPARPAARGRFVRLGHLAADHDAPANFPHRSRPGPVTPITAPRTRGRINATRLVDLSRGTRGRGRGRQGRRRGGKGLTSRVGEPCWPMRDEDAAGLCHDQAGEACRDGSCMQGHQRHEGPGAA